MKWWEYSWAFELARSIVDELELDTVINEASLGAKFTVKPEELEKTLSLAVKKETKFWTSYENGEIIIYILGN